MDGIFETQQSIGLEWRDPRLKVMNIILISIIYRKHGTTTVIDRKLIHTVTAYAKNGDYILGVVFYPKPSSVSDVAGIQSVHASLN